MEARKNVPEIIDEALNGKFPDSEAKLRALDQTLGDEDVREYLSKNSSLRHQFEHAYRQGIRETADQLWQLSRFLFCQISDTDMGNIKEGEQAPDCLKKLPMVVNMISYTVIDEILSARDCDKRTIIAERWIAVMLRSLEIGDIVAAFSIFSALESDSISRLKIDLSLSEQARQLLLAMIVNKINVLVSPIFMDKLIASRKDLLIPHHGHYKTMLLSYNESLDKIDDDEAKRKISLFSELVDSIEAESGPKNANKSNIRNDLDLILAERKDIDEQIGLTSTRIKRLKDKIATELLNPEDEAELNRLKAELNRHLKLKTTNIAEMDKLWHAALKHVHGETKEKFAARWTGIEADCNQGRRGYRATMAMIETELNVRKHNLLQLDLPLSMEALNDFQRRLLLGMTREKFDAEKEENYQRSKKRVPNPAEPETSGIFRSKNFSGMILDEKQPLCIRTIMTIMHLFDRKSELLKKLKGLKKPEDVKTREMLGTLIYNLDSRGQPKEMLNTLRVIIKQLKGLKSDKVLDEYLKGLEEMKDIYKKLDLVFEEVSAANPLSIPKSKKTVAAPAAPVVSISEPVLSLSSTTSSASISSSTSHVSADQEEKKEKKDKRKSLIRQGSMILMGTFRRQPSAADPPVKDKAKTQGKPPSPRDSKK